MILHHYTYGTELIADCRCGSGKKSVNHICHTHSRTIKASRKDHPNFLRFYLLPFMRRWMPTENLALSITASYYCKKQHQKVGYGPIHTTVFVPKLYN